MPNSLASRMAQDLRKPVLRPVMLGALAVALLVTMAGLVLRTGDDVATSKEQHVVRSAFEVQERMLARAVKDYTWWDPAIENIFLKYDDSWVRDNFDTSLFDLYGANISAIMNAGGQILYSTEGGNIGPVPLAQEFGTALDPLIDAAMAQHSGEPRPVIGYVMAHDAPHLVAVSPFRPLRLDTAGAPFGVLIAIREVNGDFIRQISNDFLINNLRVVENRAESLHALRSMDGVDVVFIAWDPEKPGSIMLSRLLPVIILFGLIIIVLAKWTVDGLKKAINNYREQLLRVEEERSRSSAILETVADGIITADERGVIESFNRAAERIFGWSAAEVVGKNLTILMPESMQARHDGYINAYLRTGVANIIGKGREVVGRRKDGGEFPLDLAIGNTYLPDRRVFTGVVRDLTQRHLDAQREASLRDQLQQADKLKTVGTLAGGVAHDLNNVLTPILGYAELLQASFAADTPERADVEAISRGAKRAREVISQLLAFSRPSSTQTEPVPIANAVCEVIRLVQPVLPPGVEITSSPIDADLAVSGQAGKLQQVLLNLVTNAIDALRGRSGTIHVSAQRLAPGAEMLQNSVHVDPAGDYACLRVADNGCGMPPAVQARIFEPFFTTKPVGRGTGLGLAVAYGIVTRWNGDIKVHSEPDSGSTFDVLLPIVESGAPPAPDAQIGRSRGMCLVVDDQAEVLAVASRMVSRLGYDVITAETADVAIDLLRASRVLPEVILSDISMPGAPVKDLIRQAQSVCPQARIVVMSGFDIVGDSDLGGMVDAYVQKPLSLSDLSKAMALSDA